MKKLVLIGLVAGFLACGDDNDTVINQVVPTPVPTVKVSKCEIVRSKHRKIIKCL